MLKKGIVVAATIFLMCSGAEANAFEFDQGRDASKYDRGTNLVDKWESYKRTQVGGQNATGEDFMNVMDYMGFIRGICHTVNHYFGNVLPDGITVDQECSVVGKYLEAHPERWHESAVVLVIDALNNAFPKFPKRSPK